MTSISHSPRVDHRAAGATGQRLMSASRARRRASSTVRREVYASRPSMTGCPMTTMNALAAQDRTMIQPMNSHTTPEGYR